MFSQYGSSQAEEFQVSKQSQLSHLSLLETGEYSQLAHSASQASSVLRKLVFQTEFQNCFTFIPCLFQPQPSMMLLSTPASHTQHALKLPHLSDLNLAYQDSPSCGSLTLCDTPNFMHGECRDSFVNHCSIYGLKSLIKIQVRWWLFSLDFEDKERMGVSNRTDTRHSGAEAEGWQVRCQSGQLSKNLSQKFKCREAQCTAELGIHSSAWGMG